LWVLILPGKESSLLCILTGHIGVKHKGFFLKSIIKRASEERDIQLAFQ
jgi:hypothetical protein